MTVTQPKRHLKGKLTDILNFVCREARLSDAAVIGPVVWYPIRKEHAPMPSTPSRLTGAAISKGRLRSCGQSVRQDVLTRGRSTTLKCSTAKFAIGAIPSES
jgi:hypothetical protein